MADRGPLLAWAALITVVAVGSAACSVLRADRAPEAGEVAEVEKGRDLIQASGCGTCHTIPGVRGADGLVAPPLTHFSQRAYIAGQLVNTPENLARWIHAPQEVEPGTAMPDLGLTEAQARSIAAYLHSLD